MNWFRILFPLLAFAAAGISGGLAQEPEPDQAADTVLRDSNGVEIPEPTAFDWSLLDPSIPLTPAPAAKIATKTAAPNATDWKRADKPDGSTAVTVKQSLLPLWDTRVGADLNVAGQVATTSADVLTKKISGGDERSSGSAWASMTAPGVGSVWDKTAIEARLDPTQDQSKFGAALTKSLPLGERYALTLQNGYNVTQQTLLPLPGTIAHPMRNYETDRSAKLSVFDTGTSFIAGQTLSTADDKWLTKVGAEQKLFGGVSVSGTVSETPEGVTNRSISAGFKRSW